MNGSATKRNASVLGWIAGTPQVVMTIMGKHKAGPNDRLKRAMESRATTSIRAVEDVGGPCTDICCCPDEDYTLTSSLRHTTCDP